MQRAVPRKPVDREITPVQGEDGVQPFALGQMHEGRVRRLGANVCVDRENARNSRKVALIQWDETGQAVYIETAEQPSSSIRAATEHPQGFRDDRPAVSMGRASAAS